MKKCLPVLVFGLLSVTALFAGNNPVPPGSNKTSGIDVQDTVVFDLYQASIAGNVLQFPVYIKSDDQVFALDFAFKYNQLEFDYDTILNNTSYIDMLSYYNANDSTVRLTSYSFGQPYDNDSILVWVRFHILSGNFCMADMYDITAQLNGDMCTGHVVDCSLLGVHELNNLQVEMYPNPASDFIHVSAAKAVSVSITDTHGKLVLAEAAGETHHVDVRHLPCGMYLMQLSTDHTTESRKMLIAR